ncbi:dicarboxylate/amino acid:cation symporter [Sinomicrobium soli]|uniref:dicarboxylate/amino acid:cation symporter n=1 Tax=Sinomicrobium sp. N-1-3-6 TaxID=2219864 RepID=UPI000DCE16EE|nr:dicarboxylate/amino acid:cation symporter [Sinomicrobium sp. N-1-3-6]RAV28676.1 dicarboxylate/amino acid:cation symporter [Sinomicrobium sp. N-1-3-6]
MKIKIALHWQIVIGMVLGVVFGLVMANVGKPDAEIKNRAAGYNRTLTEITAENQELAEQLETLDERFAQGQAGAMNYLVEKEQLRQQVEKNEERISAAREALRELPVDPWGKTFIEKWVYPLGELFINLLKLIAIPLIIASLIKGIADLKDISKLSSIGIRTMLLYIMTTVFAITIGLGVANMIQPGSGISEETIERLTSDAGQADMVSQKISDSQTQTKNLMEFIVDIVPDNVIGAMGDNNQMLQVIFFTIMLGVCMLLIGDKKAKPLKKFFDSLNDAILKMVDLIIKIAPIAVFALLANVVVGTNDVEVLLALLKYSFTVILGLTLMVVVYMTLVAVYARKNPLWFLKQISPVQLLAFSTSSSAATLPVNMERVRDYIGVDEEVSSFVLPIGATINMDGTSLYQAVATIFICEALHFDITFADQLTIIFTALLASIGTAGVPGVGVVMLIIVLQSINFPPEKLPLGIALILSVDRILDMCRTAINVSGDATVATVVAKSVGKLGEPLRDED